MSAVGVWFIFVCVSFGFLFHKRPYQSQCIKEMDSLPIGFCTVVLFLVVCIEGWFQLLFETRDLRAVFNHVTKSHVVIFFLLTVFYSIVFVFYFLIQK